MKQQPYNELCLLDTKIGFKRNLRLRESSKRSAYLSVDANLPATVFRKRIIPVTAFIILCLFGASNSALGADSECWDLIQTSLITGKHRLIVSPKAFRIQSIGNRYTIVSKAPDWRVYLFNNSAKTIYSTAYEKFQGNLANGTGAFGGYLENLPILRRPRTKDVYAHLPALTMHIENPAAPQHGKKKKSMGYSGVAMNTGEVQTGDYWMWDNPNLPPSFQIVLNKLYRLPPGGVPLKFITVNTERETNIEVDTTSVKKIPYEEKLFVPPTGFTTVKEELSIVNDSSRNRAVKNLIQSWDQWGKIVDTDKN